MTVDRKVEIVDPLIGIEQDLRLRFLRDATIIDPEKRYISVPFVNQLLDPKEFDRASDLIIEQYRRRGVSFDRVTGIQYSGIPLAFMIAAKLGIPFAPSRKENKIPGAWKHAMVIPSVHSHTTNSEYPHAFNHLESGDRVLVVDDVIATGDASVPILRHMQESGMNVEKASFWAKEFSTGIDRLRSIGVEPVYSVGVEDISQDSNGIWGIQLSPPQFS